MDVWNGFVCWQGLTKADVLIGMMVSLEWERGLAALADGLGGLADKPYKERMRPVGTRFEFGMILHAHHERVSLDFSCLYELAIWGETSGH